MAKKKVFYTVVEIKGDNRRAILFPTSYAQAVLRCSDNEETNPCSDVRYEVRKFNEKEC